MLSRLTGFSKSWISIIRHHPSRRNAAAYLSGQQGAAPHVQLKEYLTLGLLRRAHAKALGDAVENAESNALNENELGTCHG